MKIVVATLSNFWLAYQWLWYIKPSKMPIWKCESGENLLSVTQNINLHVSYNTHNQPEPYTTSQNHPQPCKTSHNQAKPYTTSQNQSNHTQPGKTIQNHTQTTKTLHKSLSQLKGTANPPSSAAKPIQKLLFLVWCLSGNSA